MLIDPHVHLRDWNQADRETVYHGLSVARECGIVGLFEMPNTDPPLTSPELLRRRILLGDAAREQLQTETGGDVFHGIYGGLTSDPAQIRDAVAAQRELFPRVVGFKLFAGHSTGNMGVITVAKQLTVWQTLAQAGYTGVVAVHAEREDLLKPDLWDAMQPRSHQKARPPLAEIASVQTQLVLAEAAGFRGTIHIVHVTHPDTAVLIRDLRQTVPFTLSAGVLPAHILIPASRGWKINPPIRQDHERQQLWRHLVSGTFDWIESDHAPHTSAAQEEGAAGLPGIPAFAYLAEVLRKTISPGAWRARTGERVLEVFGLDRGLFPEISPQEEGITAEDFRRLSREYQPDVSTILSV
jgi:dihydroorotase